MQRANVPRYEQHENNIKRFSVCTTHHAIGVAWLTLSWLPVDISVWRIRNVHNKPNPVLKTNITPQQTLAINQSDLLLRTCRKQTSQIQTLGATSKNDFVLRNPTLRSVQNKTHRNLRRIRFKQTCTEHGNQMTTKLTLPSPMRVKTNKQHDGDTCWDTCRIHIWSHKTHRILFLRLLYRLLVSQTISTWFRRTHLFINAIATVRFLQFTHLPVRTLTARNSPLWDELRWTQTPEHPNCD